MSVHLTVIYQSDPAAAKSPATNPAAVGDNDSGPLGFLAALIDNLTQAASGQADATAAVEPETPAAPDMSGAPAGFETTLRFSAEQPAPGASELLDAVTAALADLQQAQQNGELVDPELLKKLAAMAEALTGLFSAMPAVAPPIQADPATPASDIANALATTTQAGVPRLDSPATLLATKLGQLATALAQQSPDLAAKFEGFATQLATLTADSGVDPDVLAKLNLAATTLRSAPGIPSAAAPSGAAPENAAPKADPKSLPLSAAIDLKLPNIALGPRAASHAPSANTAGPETATSEAATISEARPPAGNSLKVAIEAIKRDSPDDTAKADNGIGRLVSEIASDGKSSSANAAAAAPPAQLGAVPRSLPQPYLAPAAQANIPQVAFQMVQQFHQGQSRFQIRLDPPELGRVDVKMHVDSSGNVHARLTVERTETLDLFQRDQRSLEKALAQAGLDSSKTSLEFSLKQNPSGHQSGGQDSRSLFPGFGNARTASADETAIPVVSLYRGMASAGGVNMFV